MAGRASLTVLSGGRGLGKSTALAGLAERAGRAAGAVDVRQVRGAAWESGTDLALLSQLVPGLGLLPGRGALALAEQVVGAWFPRGTAPGAVLVLVDDADRADVASLQVLTTAVRHHRHRPLLVVLARCSDHSGDAAELLDGIADEQLLVEPMSAAEVALAAQEAGVTLHPTLSRHLAAHTGGRPDRVAALLRDEPAQTWRGVEPPLPALPRVLSQTRSRVELLGAGATALVQAVAVLGDGHPAALATAVAGVEDLVGALDEAERAGILRRRRGPTSTSLEIVDPMVAAAVRTLMGPARESELHRRAAERAEDRTVQLLHAAAAEPTPDARLAHDLHQLARERAGEGAWAAAAELYQSASRKSLAPAEREERLLLAVDALVGAGDVHAATSYLAEVEGLRETPMRSAVLGYLAIMRGRATEAAARLQRSWELEHGGRHPDVAATTAQRFVLHHLARCDGPALVTWADRTVQLVGRDHPTAVEAQAVRGLGLGSTGRLPQALDSYRDLQRHAARGAVGQRVQMGAGWLHLAADEVDLARAQLSTAVPTDQLGGSVRISLWARAWLARTHFVSGEWDQALAVASSGLDLAERSGVVLLDPLLRWTIAQVHALRGHRGLALASIRAATVSDYEVVRVPTALARAAVAEAEADYAGVLSALSPLARADVSPGVSEPGFWPWADVYANALVIEGRLAEAEDFLRPHLRLARERDHRSTQARLGYARGRLLGARGDLPASREAFEEALALLEPLPLVYDRARVTFAYGQTLRRAGKRREADAVISAAREDWAALGATTYVRRCERELRAGGVNAVRQGRPAEALTAQEQAVATLVEQGMSNREVAAELFLSVKTVQFHLTRVYAKLGVRSRSQLAAARVPAAPDPQEPR